MTKQADFILARAERLIIFTDLDATLLDHNTYRFDAARPALERIRQEAIPLILTSSKTFEEMVEWHHRLHLDVPFIFENGGGLAFPLHMVPPAKETVQHGDFRIQLLSPRYEAILTVLSPLKDRFRFRGFADLTPEAIAKETGLPVPLARKAKKRLCSEPIIWEDTPDKLEAFRAELAKHGLQIIKGGRFFHVLGNQASKGKAVTIIQQYFQQTGGRWASIGVGDSPNDLPMLEAVDIPVVVQRPDGRYLQPLPEHAVRAEGIGPVGWNRAILALIQRWKTLQKRNEKE